jgi:hypothetical protein
LDQKEETGGNQDVAWWGSSYAQDYSAQTPTATTFMRAQDPNSSESSSGFISLMDEASILVAPAHIHSQHSHEQEDEEDLGFGNSRNKKPSQDTSEASQSPPMTVNTEPVKVAPQGPGKLILYLLFNCAIKSIGPEGEGASSGSWISRWWRKGDANAPGPIKASLGEETSFVYDKELKRWVNKKVRKT